MNSKRRAWVIAIAVSLALHCAFTMTVPSFSRSAKEEPVMMVSLTFRKTPKTTPTSPVATQPTQQQKDIPHTPKQAEQVKEPAKKPAQATSQTKTEISATPANEIPQQGKEESATGTLTQGGTHSGESTESQANGESSGGVVDIGTLVVTKKISPDYPSFSRKRKEEGTVKIIITIENGIVSSAEIEQSSGYERLDASALRAVKQWRFDHSSKVRARVPFAFKLR